MRECEFVVDYLFDGEDEVEVIVCAACGKIIDDYDLWETYNYCPYCGAKRKGGEL